MFRGDLQRKGSHFQLLFEKLLQNEPKNNLHFRLKTLKLNIKPLITYKMI